MFIRPSPFKYNFGFIASGLRQALGSGKTIFLVDIAERYWETYNVVYANFHLNEDIIENFYYLDEIDPEIILGLRKNSLVLLQESHNYFDRRYCTHGINKKNMYAFFQVRKKGIDVFGDVVKLQYLEKRVTDIGTQYWCAFGNPQYKHPKYDPYFIYSEMNIYPSYYGGQPVFREKGKYIVNLRKCYECYNTNEMLEIKVPEKKKDNRGNYANLNEF